MISSLQVEERVNRSHQSCGVDVSSARTDLACSIHVRRRKPHNITGLISFSPQTPLRRPAFEAALRRRVLFNINHTSLEA
jgi:hypothetical protein